MQIFQMDLNVEGLEESGLSGPISESMKGSKG
jgi:hypothetical protein